MALTLMSAIIDPQIVNGTVKLRVDWNGASARGTMDVWTQTGWRRVGHLAPGSLARDVLLARFTSGSESITLAFERGPAHRDVPFQAWARPITWRPGQPPLRDQPIDFTPERGTHYAYAGTERPTHDSILQNDGHRVVIELDLDHYDYELWVKLRHPTEDRWSIIDPIIGHADRGGTPGDERSSTPVGSPSDAVG